MRKSIIAILVFLIIGLAGVSGYFIFGSRDNGVAELNAEELHKKIIEERNYAISLAVESGDYRCCINPPCTMCYMEANQWNNYTAGSCACDDLIAQGKEACPQCERSPVFPQGHDNELCDISVSSSSGCEAGE